MMELDGGRDERLKDSLHAVVGIDEFFRMPLNADEKLSVGAFDAFDDAVRRRGSGDAVRRRAV